MPSQHESKPFPELPPLFSRDEWNDQLSHTVKPGHPKFPFVEGNIVVFRNPALSAPGTRSWVFARITEHFDNSPWFVARTSPENFTGMSFLLTGKNAPVAVRESFATNLHLAGTSRTLQMFNADTITNVVSVLSLRAATDFVRQAREASASDSVAK